MEQNNKKSNSKVLRQKAEDLLKKNNSKTNDHYHEADNTWFDTNYCRGITFT